MLFGLSDSEILKKLDSGDVRIAVYGLGRVGLPLAVAWLRAGQRVLGVDVDERIVESINSGVSPISDEPMIPEAVKHYVDIGMFKATTNLVEASRICEAKFVAVPTGIVDGKFNGVHLERALRGIGRGLKRGDAVCVECTVPPMTTETFAKSILESESGLRAEEDFALAFSPERIYEGRALEDLEVRYPKIVGGVGQRSTHFFSLLYRRITKRGVIEMGSARAAELSKIFEGVYRDVNIALANELAALCSAYGVDFFEVREASNSQPFCHLHKPGVGVGGPCIPVYPYFLFESASRVGLRLELTRLARTINEDMPSKTVSILREVMSELDLSPSKTSVAVFGLAFRGNVADSRDSPTYEIVRLLLNMGVRVVVHDPYISMDQKLKSLGVTLTGSVEEAVKGCNVVIVATDHDYYRKLDWRRISNLMSSPKIIFDGRGILDTSSIPSGITFVGIGRPKIRL
ncbi:MAG: nucleotide sugar dehydrogenase [archaeon YNP-WB-062]|nr:nucleotide sugar dehydrogenase [Candidatus Culexarchaeum yellowstonense]